ncbi:MAG: hypothetical protein AAGI50_12790 [Pseudomonadota bacterium]
MSTPIKLAAMLLAFGLAACGQQEEPAPQPVPVIVPEPVFTGKG